MSETGHFIKSDEVKRLVKVVVAGARKQPEATLAVDSENKLAISESALLWFAKCVDVSCETRDRLKQKDAFDSLYGYMIDQLGQTVDSVLNVTGTIVILLSMAGLNSEHVKDGSGMSREWIGVRLNDSGYYFRDIGSGYQSSGEEQAGDEI